MALAAPAGAPGPHARRGGTWRAEGVALAEGSSKAQPISEQVVAGSTTSVYALTGDGEVLGTSNAGVTWTRQPVPRPAFQLAMSGGTVWSLACTTTPNHATAPALIGLRFCRPTLERASARGGPWTQVSIPPLTHVLDAQLTFVSDSMLVLGIDHAGSSSGELLFTLDGGRRWSRELIPRGTDTRAPAPAGSQQPPRARGGSCASGRRPPAAAPRDCCERRTTDARGRRSPKSPACSPRAAELDVDLACGTGCARRRVIDAAVARLPEQHGRERRRRREVD